MALQIKSVDQLQELAESFKLKIRSLDDLQELLLLLNQDQASPEERKEAMQARERRLEKTRHLEHVERMRALEMGFDPDSAEADAKVAAEMTETVGWISIAVPLGLAGIAVGATAIARENLETSYMFLIALAIIWGTMGLVAITALFFCQMILRQKVTPRKVNPPSRHGMDVPHHMDINSAIKEPDVELDGRVYN